MSANSGALQQANLTLEGSHRRSYPISPQTARAKPVVFATALIEEDSTAKSKRVARTGLALAIQILVVGALLLVPLVVIEAIDLHQFNKTLLVAPPPPAPPAPPAIRTQPVAAKLAILHPQLTAPTIIPKQIVATAPDLGSAAPGISDVGVAGGTGDALGASLNVGPPPPAAIAPARPKGPIRISTGMKEPRVLVAPPVEYSPIARQARVQGVVTLEAVIDEQGNVTQVRALTGPGLLMASAVKAVAGRKYEVTYLDGQPVAIRLEVTVNFRLNS